MIFAPANQRLVMLAVVATGLVVLITVLLFQLGSGLAEAQEPPPNSPATGAPIIIGTVQASETLTVDTSEISDGDGLVNATFGYQWISNDGTTDTDIAYATRSTYIIKPWDLGNYIKMRVNFTDDAGNEETLTSVATAAVEASPNKTPTGAPFLSGMAEAGQALKVLVFGISDANGMRHATLYYQYATFSYQWIRSDGTTDIDIPDATGSSYTLTDADEGKTIKVRVSFIDDGANSEALTSSATATVTEKPSTSELSAPTALSARWSQGEEKGIDLEWNAPEGTVTSYQILRTEEPTRGLFWWEPLPHGCTPLMEVHITDTGSDTTSYTDTDVAESASYIYSVRAINSDGVGRKSSTSTQLQYRPHGYWPNGVPGSPRRAPTNLASTQIKNGIGLTWDAPEGEVTGYQILRRIPEQCEFGYRVYVENTNSTDTRWADRDVVAGTRCEYHVRAINDVGAGRLDTRNSTSFRPATLVVGPEPNSPATGTPTITGTAQVGETLTADPSGIADADGMSWARFNYQWLSSRDTEIAGATNSTYTLQASDANKLIKVRVTFIDDSGYKESPTSEATSAVASNVPATGAPIITGTVVVGETLTADTSGIDDADGLDNVPFSYQWIRSDGTTDWDIEGATGATYTVAAHLGQVIKVRVNFTDDAGNAESLTSSATVPVPIAEVTLTFNLEGTTVTCDYYNVHTVNRPYKECDDPSSTEQGESGEIEVELAIARSPSSQLYEFHFHIYQMEDSLGHDKGVEANDLCLGPGLADSVSIETTPDDGTGPFTFTDEGTIFELCPAGTYQLYVPWYMYNYDNQEYELAGTFRRYFFIDGNDEVDTSIEKVNFITPLYPDPPASHDDVLITGTQESRVINRELTPFSLSIDGLVPDSDTETTDYAVRLRVIGDDGREVPWCHVGNVGYSYLLKTVPEGGAWAMEAHLLGGCTSHGWPEILWIELFNGSYEFIAGKDIALGALPNSAATGAPTISGTPTVGQTLTASASNITDTNGLDNAAYTYQWIRSDGSTDTDIPEATGTTYLVTANDVGKTIRVKVSFTDDAENQESLTSEATETVGVSELHDRPYNLQATVAEGAITLTWQDPDTHPSHGSYHILRHRPELGEDKGLVYVEYTPSTDRTFTDSAVEPGVLYVYAVKAVKDYFGFLGAASDPVEVRMPLGQGGEAPNSPATGVPTISGTAQVGETLTVDTSGISDPDGLESATFSYQWIRNYGTNDYAYISGATGPTYTLVSHDAGKTIQVLVSFTDDADNEETLTSTPTETVDFAVQSRTVNTPATGQPTIVGTPRVGERLTVDLSSIADEDGLENAEYGFVWFGDYSTERQGGRLLADTAQITLPVPEFFEFEVSWLAAGTAISVQVYFTDDAGNYERLTSEPTEVVPGPLKGFSLMDTTDQSVVATLTYDSEVILDDPANGSYGARVDLAADAQVGSVRLDFSYGQYVRTDNSAPYSLYGEDANGLLGEGLPAGTNYLSATAFSESGQGGDPLQILVVRFTVAEPNSPSTGAPTIVGTPQVGQTLTADTSGIADADGLENVAYSYQWLSSRDTEIEGATSSTYSLQTADEGKTIRVRVSFTDDAGNDETLTSAATAEVEVPLTAELQNVPDNHNGQNAFTFHILFSEDITVGYQALKEDSFEISDGTITRARRVNGREDLRQFTVRPSSDAAVVLELEADRPCGDDGAICTSDGKRLSNRLALTVPGPVPANALATGAPTINGTAQVGQTLTVTTSNIADSDGLVNAAYGYQWVRNDGGTDAEIQDATGSTYTLDAADEGKTVKVRVSFTDDAGNEETLASAPTVSVEARSNSPATGVPTISGEAQVGETLTAHTSGISDEDGLANATFGYQWMADDSDIAGATDSAYTLADADVGRTIRVTVSFTDDAGNEETMTSEATAEAAGLPPEPLTARFENQPSSHDGENVFTFELRFSEQFHLSYRTLRDHAFTVTGGTVKKAKRMEQGSNIHWRITVRPDSNSEVSIVLPVTTDCDGQGAICTEDGRELSNRNELTVSGPGG